MEGYKLQENNPENEAELQKVIASISQLQKDTSDFGQPIVNMSNRSSIEEVENKIKTINQTNRELLSKMGVEVCLHKIIHFNDKQFKQLDEIMGKESEYYGDINSVNVLALKLLDGSKFANYINYLNAFLSKCNEENPSQQTIINFYKKIKERGEDEIFYFLSDDIFRKFDFYIDENLIEEPNDSLFELMKSGEKIVDVFRKSHDTLNADKMEDTIFSLKNGYYKEYRKFEDGPGSFSSFGGNIQFLQLSRIKGDPKLEEMYKQDFRHTWELDWDNKESNLDFEKEHFRNLLKISENYKSIEDKIFLREATAYFVFLKKSLEAAKFYYNENLSEKFKEKFKKMLFEFINSLENIQQKSASKISEEKNKEIKDILDRAKIISDDIIK